MFLRISRGRYVPTTEADVTRIVEEQLVPVMQALPGFQHYYGGVNRSASTLVAVSHWDTEENANFSREVIADAVTALMGQGVTLEAATVYEVLAEV